MKNDDPGGNTSGHSHFRFMSSMEDFGVIFAGFEVYGIGVQFFGGLGFTSWGLGLFCLGMKGKL